MMISDDEETDFIGFSPVKEKEEEPIKVDQVDPTDIEQANAMAKQLHVFKPGITFVPGAKLEVLDVRDNRWYHCKVVEVDWGELDILVHYERWSVRFDEWLKMDSTRIRPIDANKEKKIVFRVGEKVLGYWAPDSKYYFCQIKKHSSDDNYEVLFYDGFIKNLRTSQLKKITNQKQLTGIDFKSPRKQLRRLSANSGFLSAPEGMSPSLEEPTFMGPDLALFDSPSSSTSNPGIKVESEVMDNISETQLSKKNIFDVKILDEKRKTKRKPDVEEVFKIRKRKRRSEKEAGKLKKTSKQKAINFHGNIREELMSDEGTSKLKTSGYGGGTSSEGMPPDDCKYFEIDIGHGWKKVCNRRMHGAWMGKWDVFFVTPDMKKLRVRPELLRYCNEHQSPINPSELDFSVRSAKQKYDAMNQREKQNACQIKQEVVSDDELKVESKELNRHDISVEEPTDEFSEEDDYVRDDLVDSSDDESEDESIENEPKTTIKDIVKKRISSSSESEVESSPEKRDVSSVKLSQILVDTMKKEDNEETTEESFKHLEGSDASQHTKSLCKTTNYSQTKTIKLEPHPDEPSGKSEMTHKCPSKNCEKSFRKENLLQMHMKHYHPELLKRTSLQAPNVADLAYARTVDDHLDVASLSPSSISFPPVEFMVPDKKEGIKKSKQSEVKKFDDKKSKGKVFKGFKDPKKEKEPCKEEASDSDYGNDSGIILTNVKEEEESLSHGKAEIRKIESDNTKSKIPKRLQREKVGIRSDTTKRRNRKSESMSEDDPTTEKVTKYRTSKRKTISGPKRISIGEGQPESLEAEEENIEGWNDPENQDAIIHCGCESQEEDGLMLQCDVCLTWQHGGCYNIENEEQVPEKYICSICENPRGQRSSMRFKHHQEWLKEGKLPRFSFSTSNPNVKLESCIRRGHDLSANVSQLSQLIHSLRLKLNISREADHPKFVMWHKKWEDPPPENIETKKIESNPSSSQVLPSHDFIPSFNQTVSSELHVNYTSVPTKEENVNKDQLTSEKIQLSIKDTHVLPSETLDSKSSKLFNEEFHTLTTEENLTDKKSLDLPQEKINDPDKLSRSAASDSQDETPKIGSVVSVETEISSTSEKLEISPEHPKEINSIDNLPEIISKREKEAKIPCVDDENKLLREEKPEEKGEETQINKSEQKLDKQEGTQDSLEDAEDLELALGALGAGGESSINEGLVDLLSSNPVFEQLVDVTGSELAPLVQNTVAPNPAPIIPKNERIEPANCKRNLLHHVELLQEKAFQRFDYIEEQIKALEAEMGLTSEISREEEELLTSGDIEDRDAATLQARALVNLTLRDIDTVKKLALFADH